jgi:peptide/nickel transport system substrate-binding protein
MSDKQSQQPSGDVLAHSLSRRTLLRAALATSAATALAACAQPVAPAGQAGAASTAAETRGTLRLAHILEWGGKEVLDPASPNRFFPPIELLYNRLVRLNNSGVPEPDLALSWEADPSAQTWTFTLREGVHFHDGKPLTSKDVVYTLQHVVDPELGSPGASVLEIVDVTALEAPDDQTVVIKLKQPHADFPLLLLHYSCYVIPEGSAETIATTGIGTGPFKLQSLNPEGKTVVVANDDYWEGKPGLAAIEMVSIPDGEARTAALLADQIDYGGVSFGSAALVERNANLELQSIGSGNWLPLVMNVNNPPFDDPKVRMAMKLVVNREEMLQTVLNGYGALAWDHPVWPGDQYHLAIDRQQDIEQAKALLAEAGYPDGIDVVLHTTPNPDQMVPLAVTYKEQAAAAGIRVEIQQDPSDSYWNDVWMKVDFCTSFWGERQADQVLNEVFRSGASWNESFWNNAEFDQLLDDARNELNFEARKALYQQAQQLLADDGGSIIPIFYNNLRARHLRVQGIVESERFFLWHKISIQA